MKNRREGFGIKYYADGHRFEGYWKDGKRHGRGKTISAEGHVVRENWDMDKRI